MKTLVFATSVSVLLTSSVFAAERGINLSVPGMFCASCPFIVQAAIGKVEGVLSVTTDLDKRTAFVRYDDAIATIDEITSASTNAGYEATVIIDDMDQS